MVTLGFFATICKPSIQQRSNPATDTKQTYKRNGINHLVLTPVIRLLFDYPGRCWRVRIFDFHPVRRSPGAIRPIPLFGDDPCGLDGFSELAHQAQVGFVAVLTPTTPVGDNAAAAGGNHPFVARVFGGFQHLPHPCACAVTPGCPLSLASRYVSYRLAVYHDRRAGNRAVKGDFNDLLPSCVID